MMKNRSLVLLGAVLITSLLLGNCATEPVVDEPAAPSVEDTEVQRGDFPEPSLLVLLPELREEARSQEPSHHHLGWDIHELDDYVYGRNINKPDHEFAAGDVETLADEIVLKGPALVMLPNEEFIESTNTGEIRFNNDGTFSKTGGDRVRYGFPRKSGAE